MDENLIGCATLPLQALLVWLGTNWSPRHRMPLFIQETRVEMR
jgi:hypothetical protein